MSYLFPIYQLYLFQLENYEIGRFWSLLFKRGYFGFGQSLRKKLVLTPKVLAIILISFLLFAFEIWFLAHNHFSVYLIVLLILLIIFLAPVLYTIALILIWPIDFLFKKIVINQTKKLLKSNSGLKIVGIAGSYGKTTMKHVLTSVLSAKFKVLSTPESVNTPVGIAHWINKSLRPETEILIIEMGEHYRGDIKYLCSITRPDIAVITGINESHFERLKSINDTINTVFEIAENARPDACIVLNAEDQNIINNYTKFVGNHKVFYYGSTVKESGFKISDRQFDTKELAWNFKLDENDVRIPILGEYIIDVMTASIIVGQQLGMPVKDILESAKNIKPVPHRLEPIDNGNGILVIDDSYNGNPNGAKEAIEVLSKFENRRKIYITPGLVEMGRQAETVHSKIGRELAEVADKVILIKTSVTPFIAKGLKENNFSEENIIWFESAKKAHDSLGDILQPNDVILFQNDWGDQYI